MFVLAEREREIEDQNNGQCSKNACLHSKKVAGSTAGV